VIGCSVGTVTARDVIVTSSGCELRGRGTTTSPVAGAEHLSMTSSGESREDVDDTESVSKRLHESLVCWRLHTETMQSVRLCRRTKIVQYYAIVIKDGILSTVLRQLLGAGSHAPTCIYSF